MWAGLVAAFAVALPAAAAQAPTMGAVNVVKNTGEKITVEVPVASNGSVTRVHLEFGRTESLGGTTNVVELRATQTSIPVTFGVTGLSPRTTYFFRAVAENDSGQVVSEIGQVTTGAPPSRTKVLKAPAIAFAISTGAGGAYPWRVLAAARPKGLPTGTRLTIRCHAQCQGSKTVRLDGSTGQIRFGRGIRITRESVLEIRATKIGYTGRIRRYVFRGSGSLIVAKRVLNRCLSGGRPAACPK